MSKKQKYASRYLGKTYVRLTILEWVDGNDRCTKVKAKCECGNVKTYTLYTILNGVTNSCGCYGTDQRKKANTTHGLHYHPLKHVWRAMLDRCYNSNFKQFKDYGLKGVIVCEDWRNSFVVFYEWCIKNGWKKGLQIDKDIVPKKLGVDGKIYCPEYCCFVTRKENMRERTNSHFITHEGVTRCLSEWAEIKGLKPRTIFGRLAKGWSISESLDTPIMSNDRIVDYNGELIRVMEVCERIGLNPNTFRNRLARGWSVDRIINTPAHKYNKK